MTAGFTGMCGLIMVLVGYGSYKNKLREIFSFSLEGRDSAASLKVSREQLLRRAGSF